ncbi:DUF6504 family protein [Pseudoclavibacter soli]|uniref:DUF6504 family protein n=1 Tax=Pseudoclavibacter soli TaxID=452623 RepID=UPI0004051967|nr:DUF6504 family protein [Pseudoclavibacter soli]
MPEKIDEPVTVVLSPEGEPRSFVWRRFEYEITGVPQAFFRRRPWWQPATGPTAAVLERIDRELWRVEASCTGDDFLTYDLAREPDGQWRLQLAWR